MVMIKVSIVSCVGCFPMREIFFPEIECSVETVHIEECGVFSLKFGSQFSKCHSLTITGMGFFSIVIVLRLLSIEIH